MYPSTFLDKHMWILNSYISYTKKELHLMINVTVFTNATFKLTI